MKILLGVPEYPPNHIGGGGVVYKSLVKSYQKLGHEVIVVYGYYPTVSLDEKIRVYFEDGVKFYQVPEFPVPHKFAFLRTAMPPNFRALLALKKIVKSEMPNAAHLHGYGLIFINYLSFVLNRLGIKYVFTIHGYPESQNSYNLIIRLLWNIYINSIMRYTIKHAVKITAVSKNIAEDVRNTFKEKTVVIYNGLDIEDHIGDVRAEYNVRDQLHIPSSAYIVLSLGRISFMKGFHDFIQLIPKFLEKNIKIVYLIAGEDEGYKKYLVDLINQLGLNNNVKFLGYLNSKQKITFLEQADVVAIPSLWEPFGMVALEAMYYEKVIVSSDSGGLSEVLEGYPLKVQIKDMSVVDKVCHLVKNKPKFIVFNTNKFDYLLIAKKYLNCLRIDQYV